LNNQLDQILVSASDPDWHARLREVRGAVRGATYFEDGSEEYNQLNEILRRVRERRGADSAIIDYTSKFDKVQLTPEQFRISKED